MTSNRPANENASHPTRTGEACASSESELQTGPGAIRAPIPIFGSAPREVQFHQRPSTTSIPARIASSCRRASLPVRSVSCPLSKATISETCATESWGKPVAPAFRRTFPGAFAHLRLLVSGTQTTVPMRLRFIASHCTTTTGRLKPGAEPIGSPISAHQTSP